MIKPEQIPDEVVEAAREAWLRSDVNARDDWRAAIAAAINAWPGSTGEWNVLDDRMWITLPVQQDAGDE